MTAKFALLLHSETTSISGSKLRYDKILFKYRWDEVAFTKNEDDFGEKITSDQSGFI